jgi:predicted short-subunit dehydrogenase-like oxidoreductase (DUF2520 family)
VKSWGGDANRGPIGDPGGRTGSGPALRSVNPRESDGGSLPGEGAEANLGAGPRGGPSRGPSAAPAVGIVGAGPVGTALGVAIARAGWPVAAVSSRDPVRRETFRSLVPGARLFAAPEAILEEVELVIVAVPDDAIPGVAESMRLYGGQALVHTSGLLGSEVLLPALAAGSHIGAFHPLVSFTADVERSVAALKGATIAIEGDDGIIGLLADLAEAIGGVAVRLPPGTKPAYHAAAVMASGGLVALLDAVVTLGAVAGLDERGSLAVYGRLVEQTLANARAVGVGAALTGPITRGDVGTVRAHIEALERWAPGVVDLYLAGARRELRIAEERRALSPEQVARVRAALAKDV